MRAGQSSCTFSIGNTDCEFLKTLTGDAAGNIKGRHVTFRQSAEPVFGGDFPGGCSTDNNVIRLIRNCPACRIGQTTAVCEPPEKRVSIQQCSHRYSPSHVFSSSSDNGSKKPSGRTIFPLRTSGWRLPRGLQPTSRATGSPLRAITISSPASTCARRRDRWVLAW